jgi:glutamine amidotransferase PdxT
MDDIRELYKAAGMMDNEGRLLADPYIKRLVIELEVMPVGVEFNEFGQQVVAFETRMPDHQTRLPFGGIQIEDPNFDFKLPLDRVVLKTDD